MRLKGSEGQTNMHRPRDQIQARNSARKRDLLMIEKRPTRET